MKYYWKMPNGLKYYFQLELEQYKNEFAKGNLQCAFRHLERSHVIGQAWFTQHTYVHWLMFRFGIKIKDKSEILGQLPRLLFGGVKSFVGLIPVGNTGGANVPPLQAMEIPADLKMILKPYRNVVK
ncbi:MAG: DUF3703 domain-containing protein [Chitinophagaceae bacterium]